ncbi:MAG: nuclear transport factor 2 family protein [Planctomycetia bacterium]|nr:nuclear transport factor 2 family protein [Planctomycetia bacterium]
MERMSFRGAAVVGLLLIGASGCSSRRGGREIGEERVEPELQAHQVRAVVPVPVVIAGPRPYTAARPRLTLARVGEPRRLAPEASVTAAPTAVADERAEIRDMLGGYLRAFNQHDAAALVAHWTAAGENIDLDSGEVTAGREAVREVFTALFADDAAATIDIDVQAIRPVRADVAVVDGTSRIMFGDGNRAGSRFSAVVVKQDGRWLLESVREAARPEAAGAVARPLDALSWLVGIWEDVGPGVTASTRCFWSAGRAFLIRTHAVTADKDETGPAAGDDAIPGLLPAADVADREVTEIIGWDPERQAIRSWTFTSDGRFAEGVWTRDGDNWRVQIEGRGGDTGRDCECMLVRVGADEVSVRGPTTGLAAGLAPACDFIRIAR